MALAKAEQLITKAQQGIKLSARERRHAIAYLLATDPERASSSADLAELFKVNERMIRFDKQQIREERSKLITEEDVGLVIADIRISYENTARELHGQMKKAKEGTQVRLNYINAIHMLYLKTVEALQNLGYYPKNLGTQTINKFEYASIVHRDGSVETRSVDQLDHLMSKKITNAGERAALDAEYMDIVPALPPAPSTNAETEQITAPTSASVENTDE
jgi:hypothetical protein